MSLNKSIELDNIAIRENIEILRMPCPHCGSISLMTDTGDCYIGIDTRDMTEFEENVHKAHELGHCIKGAFYNRYSKFDIISRHEHRADTWAIKKLIPEDELIEMFENGVTETWELAEQFEVTEDFIIKACEFYGYYHRAI